MLHILLGNLIIIFLMVASRNTYNTSITFIHDCSVATDICHVTLEMEARSHFKSGWASIRNVYCAAPRSQERRNINERTGQRGEEMVRLPFCLYTLVPFCFLSTGVLYHLQRWSISWGVWWLMYHSNRTESKPGASCSNMRQSQTVRTSKNIF